MPIKDLTDGSAEEQSLRGVLRHFGKLNKGAPQIEKARKDGSTYKIVGPDLTYFRVEFAEEYKDLLPLFKSTYGLKPAHFDRVILTSPDLHTAFDSWAIEWAGKTGIMRYRCDGEAIASWYDMEQSKQRSDPRPCMKDDPGNPCKCTRTGRLWVILPEFNPTGYFTLRTGAWRDIKNIFDALAGVQALGGNIMSCPWILKRVSEEHTETIVIDGQNKRKKQTRAIVHLIAEESYLTNLLMEQFNKDAAITAPPELAQLPERTTETDEVTGEIIDDDPPAPPGNSRALPPGDEPAEFPATLMDALMSLTGMEYDKLISGLSSRVGSGETDLKKHTPVDIFLDSWGLIQQAWVGDNKNIADWMLNVERKLLQPFQVYACVNDLVETLDGKGKATKAQVNKLIDELMLVVGYEKREEGVACMNRLAAFLFAGKAADALTKKQLKAVLGWWLYQNEADEFQYYTTTLEEISLILDCDLLVQALYTPSEA